MGWRFQKRIRLLPGVTLNLSRKGVSTSIGTRGARVTLGHGKRRTTVGIPGSGISHTSVASTTSGRRARPAAQPQGVRWRKVVFVALAICVAFFFVLLQQAWAVNKCTGPDGKVAFQDAPCAGKGERLEVRPASGHAAAAAAAPSAPAAAQPLAAQPAAAPVPAPAPMPSAAQSPLASEAGMCLEWYRPRLRDPAGAYYTEPSKQGRVLSITVHATNGYGGYVTKRAACEIHNGKLNLAWTKTHAERGDW